MEHRHIHARLSFWLAAVVGVAGSQGCSVPGPPGPGYDQCTQCVLTASAEAFQALPYTTDDLKTLVTGRWSGHHPGGFGVPAFDFTFGVAPHDAQQPMAFEPVLTEDQPDCDTANADSCDGAKLPVRVTSTGIPYETPAFGAVYAGRTVFGSVPAESVYDGNMQQTRGVVSLQLEFTSQGSGQVHVFFDPDGTLWMNVDDGLHEEPDEPYYYYPFAREGM